MQTPSFPSLQYNAKEYKVVSLRECPVDSPLADNPARAVEYWHTAITSNPYFNPEVECLVALFLNTRRRVKGHTLIATGTNDTILAHPREVFRAAIVLAAASIVLMHNHPSGDPSPSEGDISVTRNLIRAGQTVKIDVVDHIVVGRPSTS